MSVSPFTYEYPVEPADVIDRAEECERLLELVTAGRFVRLLAPRRYGKTSLLRKVLAEADKQGIPTVLVDFYGVVSIAEVTHRIERAYGSSCAAAGALVAERYRTSAGSASRPAPSATRIARAYAKPRPRGRRCTPCSTYPSRR